MLKKGDVFPNWWTFVPVAGKATYVQEWSTRPLTREKVILEYQSKGAYKGLGVVTGEFSGGLIALDIDGLGADERFRVWVGDGYEAPGQESTMSWASGMPGRRQVLYRVPASVVPELRHVKTLILRSDGEWHLGHGDVERTAAAKQGTRAEGDAEYEEVVLRFNQCQSVVPGSPHPKTGGRYQFLNYNGGEVALAPDWVMTLLRGVRKPVQWLSDADQKALDAELGETAVPSRQIRGWFFKEEVQALLRPRLEELVFKHEAFDTYGWKTREGSNPQRMSGCPWHGGRSGTSFQYAVDSGCWDCKACGVGGDLLDFIYKVRSNELHAGRPQGPDLEVIVAELATALGYDYPACANVQEVKSTETPLRRMTGAEFFKAAATIDASFDNAELGDYHLMELVRDAGLSHSYRSGPAVREALERFMFHEQQEANRPQWQEEVRGQREYLIPDFLSKPSSVMLHARGGLGKTRLAVLIAKIVGQRQSMKVRGVSVEPTTSGNVLFIGSDMSPTDYAEYFDQQGIDSAGPDRWMKFKSHWQQSQYKVLLRWLKEYKPVLVIIDSLTSVSTMIAAKEYEAAYATTLYRLARENGTEFPATTFLWIHHDKKDGSGFRGTDMLRNAVHETWHLKELSDEERAEFGDNALLLEIDKSRGMRSGDRFLVREDIEEALSIEDLTPTVKRGNRGQGDEQPRTIVLGVLRDAEKPITAQELRYELNSRLSGRRGPGSMVTDRTVRRWLQHWVSTGLVVSTRSQVTGQKGRPAPLFEMASLKTVANECPKIPLFAENPCDDSKHFWTQVSACPLVVRRPTSGEGDLTPESGETEVRSAPEDDRLTQIGSEGGPSEEAPSERTHGQQPDSTPLVSENKIPETLAGERVSENDPGFSDISATRLGEGASDASSEVEWDPDDWAAWG